MRNYSLQQFCDLHFNGDRHLMMSVFGIENILEFGRYDYIMTFVGRGKGKVQGDYNLTYCPKSEEYVAKVIDHIKATPYKPFTISRLNGELDGASSTATVSRKYVGISYLLMRDPDLKQINQSQVIYDPDNKFRNWVSTRHVIEEYIVKHGSVDPEVFCAEHPDIDRREFTLQIGNIKHQSGLNLSRKTIYFLEKDND